MHAIVNKCFVNFLLEKDQTVTFVLRKLKSQEVTMRRKDKKKRRKRIGSDEEFLNRDVMSVREWMVIMVLVMIPLLNLVLLVRWASADREQTPANKVNWARGSLVAMSAVVLSASLVLGLYLLGEAIH